MAPSKRREHLVDTAIRLFSRHGFHATGVDAIVAEAGVSKKTLYRHFRSKEELIIAALRKYDGVFRNDFMRQVESRTDVPRERLLAVFDVGGEWFSRDNFFGCMYIAAVGEYAGEARPIHQVCREYKAMMRGFVRRLCVEAGVPDPDGLADRLSLLFEGATVTAHVSGDPAVARVARQAADALIAEAGIPA